MLNKLRLALLSVTTALMMLMAVVPHHHHGLAACMIVQTCSVDGHTNDSHTSHHQQGSDNDCSLHNLLNAVVNPASSQGQHLAIHDLFFPVCLPGQAITLPLPDIQIVSYFANDTFFIAGGATTSLALRAPPTLQFYSNPC